MVSSPPSLLFLYTFIYIHKSPSISILRYIAYYINISTSINIISIIILSPVDYKVTEKSFAFASKRGAPFFFASASDGTNVVQLFEEAIQSAVKCKEKPPADFYSDVMNLLGEVCYSLWSYPNPSILIQWLTPSPSPSFVLSCFLSVMLFITKYQ